MGLLDNLLLRFGYVKIARYGLTLAPDGNIVPMTALAAPPTPPTPWRAPTGGGMPLPAPELTGQTWAAPPALPFAQPPAPPAVQAAVPPPVPALGSSPTVSQVDAADSAEEEDDDGDWEWKLAMARAKARDDETQVVPKASQMAQMRPSGAPPAPPRRTPRATTPPPAPKTSSFRPHVRPPGMRTNHRAYPSRLPGVGSRPSDRPLASRALDGDTRVDTPRAPAASGGPLPRFTSKFAKVG